MGGSCNGWYREGNVRKPWADEDLFLEALANGTQSMAYLADREQNLEILADAAQNLETLANLAKNLEILVNGAHWKS